jgi:hypothetical protein
MLELREVHPDLLVGEAIEGAARLAGTKES